MKKNKPLQWAYGILMTYSSPNLSKVKVAVPSKMAEDEFPTRENTHLRLDLEKGYWIGGDLHIGFSTYLVYLTAIFLFFTVKQESIKHVEEILQDPGRQPSFSSHNVHAPVSQI